MFQDRNSFEKGVEKSAVALQFTKIERKGWENSR